jgi:hypothetical protein
VATFRGAPESLPPSVVYDPIEAAYVPMRGRVERPGPNLVIWELASRSRAAAGQ